MTIQYFRSVLINIIQLTTFDCISIGSNHFEYTSKNTILLPSALSIATLTDVGAFSQLKSSKVTSSKIYPDVYTTKSACCDAIQFSVPQHKANNRNRARFHQSYIQKKKQKKFYLICYEIVYSVDYYIVQHPDGNDELVWVHLSKE